MIAAEAQMLAVLVVEDDAAMRATIRLDLERAGYLVKEAQGADDALQILGREKFDTILCDQDISGIDGITFIERCRAVSSDPAIVWISAPGDSALVLRAMRAGAYDHLARPFTGEELVLTLRKIEEREHLKAENEQLRSQLTQRYNFGNIIAQSKSMKDILDTVRRLANFNTTVMITGESGTGKELIAQALHHHSPRRNNAFVAINCGAIPENLMESELFGHKKGAFTDATRDKRGLFEEASGGTLFLDEIGELPLHLQVKLLRALQEQSITRVGDEVPISIDVRIIAATLRDLEQDVANGRFRDDLLYRLNVVSIAIPPLRDRADDIPALTQAFIKKLNKRLGLSVRGTDPEAMKALMRYHWRGNVRELENCVERALVLTDAEMITLEALPDHIRVGAGKLQESSAADLLADDNLSIKQKGRALEIKLILRALEKTKGNRTHAARLLEISHRALLYKIKEYEIGAREG